MNERRVEKPSFGEGLLDRLVWIVTLPLRWLACVSYWAFFGFMSLGWLLVFLDQARFHAYLGTEIGYIVWFILGPIFAYASHLYGWVKTWQKIATP